MKIVGNVTEAIALRALRMVDTVVGLWQNVVYLGVSHRSQWAAMDSLRRLCHAYTRHLQLAVGTSGVSKKFYNVLKFQYYPVYICCTNYEGMVSAGQGTRSARRK